MRTVLTNGPMGFGYYQVRDATPIEDSVRKQWEAYKRNINSNAKMYVFDLSGHGEFNFPETDKSVINIGGWSEKILNFIQLSEIDPKAQVNYIKGHY